MIECRSKIFVNTDPQKRCYNGCYKSYEYQWGPWEELDSNDNELNFWKELNDYAVSQRSESAKREFRIV